MLPNPILTWRLQITTPRRNYLTTLVHLESRLDRRNIRPFSCFKDVLLFMCMTVWDLPKDLSITQRLTDLQFVFECLANREVFCVRSGLEHAIRCSIH